MNQKKPTPKQLEKFVKPFASTLDPMHNWKHILRIKRKVGFLKKQYKNIDNDFLNFLIYFHSSRKWAKKNKKKIMGLGYPASWVSKINKPTTKEGKIVWDANMLENVGRFGIRKSLTLEKYYKQSRKQTLALVKKFVRKYKFYTPLGKKLGNPGIKIKKDWIKNQSYLLLKN